MKIILLLFWLEAWRIAIFNIKFISENKTAANLIFRNKLFLHITLWKIFWTIMKIILLLFWLEAWRIAVIRLYWRSRLCLSLSLRLTCVVNWLIRYWTCTSKCRLSCFNSIKPVGKRWEVRSYFKVFLQSCHK